MRNFSIPWTSKYLLSASILFVFASSVLAQSIDLNATDYKQTITMIGGDMERSSKAIQSAINKQEMIEWGFKDIAFNTCRVQYDKNQELVEGTKNWAFYDKQVATMQAIKAVNPEIQFFATMRSDYDGYGNDNNMPDWIVNYSTKAVNTGKYGVFLADYVEYMSQQGVPIAILSVAKEWTSFVPANLAADIIATLKTELNARSVAMPLISDQGFWSLSQGLTYMKKVASLGTKDLYSSFSTHDYSSSETQTWESFLAYAKTLGIPVVHDEFSTGAGAATSGVEPAISKPIGVYIERCAAYQAGISGDVFFEIWSRGINTETRSISYPSNGTGRRLRGYYIMKQFANHILNYTYITSTINSMPSVYTMAFRKDDKVVLWVINKGSTNYTSVPINVAGTEISDSVSVHYWTNNTPIEGSTAKFESEGNHFSTSISAESMNCYLFNLKSVASAINRSDLKKDIEIYPNPLTDVLHIKMPDVQMTKVDVFNDTGTCLISTKIEDGKELIDLSYLTSGIYFIKASNGQNAITRKIIKNQ